MKFHLKLDTILSVRIITYIQAMRNRIAHAQLCVKVLVALISITRIIKTFSIKMEKDAGTSKPRIFNKDKF